MPERRPAVPYRRDIDGLRAVAVLAVILFHAGFAWFGGGYAGVDVFFVISGFLITSIILADLDTGQFSLGAFYERRARRILPALFTVLLASTVAAWLRLYPPDLLRFAESGLAVVGFGSNIFFWKTYGYFGASAGEMPLLHTWSLGVEEQFYLLYPLLLLAWWRMRRRAIPAAIIAVGAASLLFCELVTRVHPAFTFYTLPTRAWELLLGGLVALATVRYGFETRFGARFNQGMAIAGLALIAYSVVAYSDLTPFPGLYALAPAGGAALLLAFGGGTAVGGVLSTAPLVGVGLVSYSAYLWHQPLFAFVRYSRIENLDPASALVLCAATLVFAYVTWKFVESPFRDRRRVPRRRLFAATGGAALVLAGALVLLVTRADVIGRAHHPPDIAASFSMSPRQRECLGSAGCMLDPSSTGRPAFVVFGDSHTFALLPALEQAARREGRQGFFVSANGCLPFIGVINIRGCAALNAQVLEYVRRERIPRIILAGRWSYYTDGDRNGVMRKYISGKEGNPNSREVSREVFRASLATTVDAYAAAGAHVTVIEQVPSQQYDARSIYRMAAKAADPPGLLRTRSVPEERYLRYQAFVASVFRQYAGDPRIDFISLRPALCRDGVCTVGTVHASYYFDDNHLTIAGAEAVSADLEASLFRNHFAR